MPDDDSELEVALKVVAIVQTIAEDVDDLRKKAWRKMLGHSETEGTPSDEPKKEDSTKQWT